jgi:hypothetical protein
VDDLIFHIGYGQYNLPKEMFATIACALFIGKVIIENIYFKNSISR